MESVYNPLTKAEVEPPKPPRYISKFRPNVILEKKQKQDARRTMGPAKVDVPVPDQYLKKHSTETKLQEKSENAKEVRGSCTAKKPPVPTRAEIPTMGIQTKRDFVRTVTTAAPTKPQPTSVDTRKGHKQLLENSGLVPKYIRKKDYGEVPEYLLQRNEEKQRAQEEYDMFVKEQQEQGAMTHLSDAERQAVLEGLKKNWDELHQQYQSLSFVIDTLSKKAHKERLETAMKTLEADIDLFERFKTIYIPKH
uniref:Enkurin, TRPC channel interacting protein n=1 Tax=Cynoglossus semilaevis TaxID=244447 RepID=A0A3P8WXV3_CYNSE